jgi:ribose-phosphate pyrophosphokinase
VVLEKTRRGDRDVLVSGIPGVAQWSGHTPVLVDDIISSARTMIETVAQCKGTGRPPPVCLRRLIASVNPQRRRDGSTAH